MLDITSCEQLWGDYEGSELKFAIDYNGKKYMVKKPDPARKSDLDLSYINNQYKIYRKAFNEKPFRNTL